MNVSPRFLLLLLVFSMHSKAGIVPPNSLKIPVQMGTLSEKDEFQRILNLFQNRISEFTDQEILMVNKWRSPRVNASADQTEDNVWKIIVNGGLYRHRLIGNKELKLVLCHELGHHIGGAPYYSHDFARGNRPSSEGQSDYFATEKCLEKFFEASELDAVDPPGTEELCASNSLCR